MEKNHTLKPKFFSHILNDFHIVEKIKKIFYMSTVKHTRMIRGFKINSFVKHSFQDLSHLSMWKNKTNYPFNQIHAYE